MYSPIDDPHGQRLAFGKLSFDDGLDHRLIQLLAVPASSGLPALILSGQDGLTTHLAANVGEGMIEAFDDDGTPLAWHPLCRWLVAGAKTVVNEAYVN